jgi:hypothetical protein
MQSYFLPSYKMACTNKACQQLEHHYVSSSSGAAQQPSAGLGFIKGFLPFFLAFGSPSPASDINIYQVMLPNLSIVVLVTLLACEPIWYTRIMTR